MPRPLLLLFPLCLMTAAAPASAAEECSAAATQTEMNACTAQAYRESDDALNRAYAELRERLAGQTEALGLLTTAQRAWITFRDAQCAYSASGIGGGSLYPTVMAMCLDELTRKRTAEIESLAGCSEGDISCPRAQP